MAVYRRVVEEKVEAAPLPKRMTVEVHREGVHDQSDKNATFRHGDYVVIEGDNVYFLSNHDFWDVFKKE